MIPTPPTIARPGLADLATLPLGTGRQRALDLAASESLGPPLWRARKLTEARMLIALCMVAPRARLLALDMRTTLHAAIELSMPVACLPPGAPDIVIHDRVELVLRYPEEILRQPVPGHSLVQIPVPQFVHHPNVGPPGAPVQSLCLGVSLPRGYPLREAVLASYAALALQAISLSELDPAGLMNAESVAWWQANTHRLPLSREPFLAAPQSRRHESLSIDEKRERSGS